MLFPNMFAADAALEATLPAPLVSTSFLYVSSYDGNVTTLNLTIPAGSYRTTNTSLETIAVNNGCATSPSWLTLDYPNAILYCTDEGLSAPNGSLSSFKTADDGTLTLLDHVETISGPVSAVIYGDKGNGLALAEYSGSSVSAYNISDPTVLSLTDSETFKLTQPGPNASRQDAPHPHEATTDPTGQYVLVPDLGADLVRVFLANKTGLGLTPVTPLTLAPGSGPRHVAFLQTANKAKTFMYLASELANTITGFEVTYNKNGSIGFSQVYISGTHGLNETVPSGASAAEIRITPDSKFLIVSSRMEASFTIPNFEPTNSTQIPSDALINFAIDTETGGLTAVQTFPAGGMIPRQFSVNKAGTLLGVGLQQDGRVVVIERDVETGLLKDFVATANVPGEVTCVVFNE